MSSHIIYIKLIIPGFGEKDMLMPANSTINDLFILSGYSDKVSFFKSINDSDVEKVPINYVLKDKDQFILTIKKEASATIKCSGRKWVIHKNDKDNRPSSFHAHDVDNGDKLDLFTGKMYSKNNLYLRKLEKKSHIQVLKFLIKYDCYSQDAKNVLKILN